MNQIGLRIGNLRFLKNEFLGYRQTGWEWKLSEMLDHSQIDKICEEISAQVNILIKELSNFLYNSTTYTFIIENLYMYSTKDKVNPEFSIRNVYPEICDKILAKFNRGYDVDDVLEIKRHHALILLNGYGKRALEFIKYESCKSPAWKAVFLDDLEF